MVNMKMSFRAGVLVEDFSVLNVDNQHVGVEGNELLWLS